MSCKKDPQKHLCILRISRYCIALRTTVPELLLRTRSLILTQLSIFKHYGNQELDGWCYRSGTNCRFLCLPGTLIAKADALGLGREELVKGMLAAGLIGVFIAQSSTFAAEVAGCQAECGSGSGMAAAGLVQMMHGTVQQVLDAASMALQNISGLVCDPVANRVEVPCLGKNIMCGSNAISSANMILAGYDKVIPLDETIAAIYDIGLKLPLELRCTYGGLGKTPISNQIRSRLS